MRKMKPAPDWWRLALLVWMYWELLLDALDTVLDDQALVASVHLLAREAVDGSIVDSIALNNTRGTAPHNLSSDYLVVKLLMSVVYQSALPRPVVKRT